MGDIISGEGRKGVRMTFRCRGIPIHLGKKKTACPDIQVSQIQGGALSTKRWRDKMECQPTFHALPFLKWEKGGSLRRETQERRAIPSLSDWREEKKKEQTYDKPCRGKNGVTGGRPPTFYHGGKKRIPCHFETGGEGVGARKVVARYWEDRG